MTCRFCGRDDLTPQGHTSHETHCDDNPNPGIPYAQQKELGILESQEGAGTPEGHPNPDQSVSQPSGGLPDVETLSPDKSPPGSPESALTDGGEVAECPICEGADVLDAADAKAEYIDAVEHPNPKAVLGYELAEHACADPECAALWGEKFHEPLPMQEVVNA